MPVLPPLGSVVNEMLKISIRNSPHHPVLPSFNSQIPKLHFSFVWFFQYPFEAHRSSQPTNLCKMAIIRPTLTTWICHKQRRSKCDLKKKNSDMHSCVCYRVCLYNKRMYTGRAWLTSVIGCHNYVIHCDICKAGHHVTGPDFMTFLGAVVKRIQ